MTIDQALSPRTSRLIADIEGRYGPAKPSLLISDLSGATIVDNTPSPLPVVLSELSHLFTLVMVLRESDRGALSLDTRIADILAPDVVEGLCVVQGVDLSGTITVGHLLAHQSGIPDFYHRNRPGTISFSMQTETRDRKWSMEQALEIARHYPGVFAPGAKGKIHYSLTNYTLLGAILQESTGMTFDQLINLRIIAPLGLKGTFVFTEAHYDRYFSLAAVHRGAETLRIPRTLASFGAAGSVVSSPRDMITFARAWWNGELCEESWRDFLTKNQRRMFSGVVFGNGVMAPASHRMRHQLFGYAGTTGQALLLSPAKERIGFLALNTVSEPPKNLSLLAKTLESVA